MAFQEDTNTVERHKSRRGGSRRGADSGGRWGAVACSQPPPCLPTVLRWTQAASLSSQSQAPGRPCLSLLSWEVRGSPLCDCVLCRIRVGAGWGAGRGGAGDAVFMSPTPPVLQAEVSAWSAPTSPLPPVSCLAQSGHVTDPTHGVWWQSPPHTPSGDCWFPLGSENDNSGLCLTARGIPGCGHNSSPVPGGAQVPAPGQAATCVSLAPAEAQSVALHRPGNGVGLARPAPVGTSPAASGGQRTQLPAPGGSADSCPPAQVRPTGEPRWDKVGLGETPRWRGNGQMGSCPNSGEPRG